MNASDESNEFPVQAPAQQSLTCPPMRRRLRPRLLIGLCVLMTAVGIGCSVLTFALSGVVGSMQFIDFFISAITQTFFHFPSEAICWWLAWTRIKWTRDVWPLSFGAVSVLMAQSPAMYYLINMPSGAQILFQMLVVSFSVAAATWLGCWLSSVLTGCRILEPHEAPTRRTITLRKLLIFSAFAAVFVALGRLPFSGNATNNFGYAYWNFGWMIVSVCLTVASWTVFATAWCRTTRFTFVLVVLGWVVLESLVHFGILILSIFMSDNVASDPPGFVLMRVMFGLLASILIANGLRVAALALVEYCGYSFEFGRVRRMVKAM